MSAPAVMQPATSQVLSVNMSSHEFHDNTKQKRNRLQLITPGFAEGTTSTWQCTQAGLANEIYGEISMTIVVAGTVTGGKWAGASASGVSSPISYNPAPFSILRNIRFYNTASYLYRQFDGFTWYQWLRARYAHDFMSEGSGSYYSDLDVLPNVLGANNQTGTIKPGANIAAGTYRLCIPFRLPISYNHAGDRGLIVLGTENLFYKMDIDWGTIVGTIGATGGTTDLIKSLTGTGLSVTVSNVFLNMELEYYMVPFNVVDPNTGRSRLGNFTNTYMSVQQLVQVINNTGQQTFQPPPNAVYTGVALQFWSNGSPVPSASVTNLTWVFAGQVTDVIDDLPSMQARENWLSQKPPFDGRAFFDLGIEMGLYQRREQYAAFNNQTVTGLQIQANIASGVSTTNAQITACLESMQPFAQAL